MKKIKLCGLLLCLLGAAGKGYGQEVDIKTDRRYSSLVAAWNFDGDTNEFLSGDKLKANKGEIVYTVDRNLEEGKALLVQKEQFLSGLNELLPQGDSPRTVMFWMRKTGCGNADITLLHFGNNSKPRGSMDIRLRPCAEWGNYITTSFVPNLKGKQKFRNALQGEFFGGSWKHVVITYDSGVITAYCDGFSVVNYPPSPKGQRVDTASAEVALGWTNNPEERDETVICLDDVRVFSSKLNSRGIQLIYEAEASYKLETDTDEDQLLDVGEQFLFGTDYRKSDTDGDGLSDWFELGSRFQVIEGKFSWNMAKRDAEKRGGHLAVITNKVENAIVLNLLMVQFGKEVPCLWLGATDQEKEGVWKWVTGEEWEYENWLPKTATPRFLVGEPNNTGGFEHYLQIYGKEAYISWYDFTINADQKYEYHVGWNDVRENFRNNGADAPTGYLLEKGVSTNPNKHDTDEDGFSDGEEFKAKTNPIDALSFPGASANLIITKIQKVPFGFSFKTEKNKGYAIESGGNLKLLKTIREFEGTGEEVRYIEVLFFPQQYYRVRVTE